MMEDNEHLRLITLDPGTVTLGFGVIDIDMVTLKPKVVEAFTLDGSVMTRAWVDTAAGDEAARQRIMGLNARLQELFLHYRPDVVSCEDNFLARSPHAFKMLAEAVAAVRYALMATLPHSHLYLIPPTEAKKTVNACFKGTGKDDVRQGLKSYSDLDWGDISIDMLDEHAVDAIVVGVCMVEKIKAGYELQSWGTHNKG